MSAEMDHAHVALLAYARDMHQYTLELWLDIHKKIDGDRDASSVPTHRDTAQDGHHSDEDRVAGPNPDNTSPDIESPNDSH